MARQPAQRNKYDREFKAQHSLCQTSNTASRHNSGLIIGDQGENDLLEC